MTQTSLAHSQPMAASLQNRRYAREQHEMQAGFQQGLAKLGMPMLLPKLAMLLQD